MAEKRKDNKGRNLKDGESVMPDGRYRFRYTDADGKRKAVYSWRLVPTDKIPAGKSQCKPLRQLEKEIFKAVEDGVIYAADYDLNEIFQMYIETKKNLKPQTIINYKYIYSKFVSDDLGKMKIREIKKHHVISFYNDLIGRGLKTGSIHSIHTVLHPAFNFALDNDYIKKNPADRVLKEAIKNEGEKRHALTVEEQSLLIDYLTNNEKHQHWLPVIQVLLNTGLRVGELIGLTWDDIKDNAIEINHNTIYKPNSERKMTFTITTPKTKAGIRSIPVSSEVRTALNQIKRDQFALGIRSQQTINGYSNFIFLNNSGNIILPQSINDAIKRICAAANQYESERARKEGREPIELRRFSVHNLRHTACTRMIESGISVNLVMQIMGHTDIKTTMNTYSEFQQNKTNYDAMLNALETIKVS